jgi:hypothetical protein
VGLLVATLGRGGVRLRASCGGGGPARHVMLMCAREGVRSWRAETYTNRDGIGETLKRHLLHFAYTCLSTTATIAQRDAHAGGRGGTFPSQLAMQ